MGLNVERVLFRRLKSQDEGARGRKASANLTLGFVAVWRAGWGGVCVCTGAWTGLHFSPSWKV